MDVSFTNVLEGARQYFQGLPVPSTGGTVAPVDRNLTTSTSTTSSGSTTHDHGTPSSVAPPSPAQPPPQPPQPPSSSSTQSAPTSGDQETARYPPDTRPPSVDNGATSSSSFWSSAVDPYPPQPTRVEVPDTRPDDEGSSLEPSSSSPSNITLTEMQPAGHRSSGTTNYSQKQSSLITTSSSSLPTVSASSTTTPSTASSSSTDRQDQPAIASKVGSPQLHQMQTPQQTHSPGPVYQQLNNVTRTSYTTAEILASTQQPTYQMANERPSQPSAPIVAQRTQYYPR